MKSLLSQHPLIMGIVNVTPDSFSDGGQFFDPDKAIAHGMQLFADGADILDIGGESTRPGATPVPVDEEIKRVVPVIKGLTGQGVHISIDTRNAATMEAAIDAGATIINDVSALRHDDRSVLVARDAGCPVILMHAQGTPENMQKNPNYNNVINDISEFFKERIDYCDTHRIDAGVLILDPGIGFGKTVEHNLLILSNIKQFLDFGRPIMLGTSRKHFIAKMTRHDTSPERLGGSIASALWGVSQGVSILRVHNVRETRQALDVWGHISGE